MAVVVAAGAAVVMVAAVVALAVVEESHEMVLTLKNVRFSPFLKRRDLSTDGPTDRPPYKDARTHLTRPRVDQ